MQACAVMDSEIWSIAQGKAKYTKESDRVVIKYKYYLSKEEDQNGQPLRWSNLSPKNYLIQEKWKSVVGQTNMAFKVDCSKLNRRFSSDSGCSSTSENFLNEQAEKCIEELETCRKQNTAIENKKLTFPTTAALPITQGEERAVVGSSYNTKLETHTSNVFMKTKATIEPSSNLKRKAKRITISNREISTPSSPTSFLSIKKDQKSSTPSSASFSSKCQTANDSRSVVTNEKSKRSIDLSKKGYEENRKSNGESGLIVKYKYFLSTKKDLRGKPLTWKLRTSEIEMADENDTSENRQDPFNCKPKEKVLQNDSENVLLVQYHYIKDFPQQQIDKRKCLETIGEMATNIHKNYITTAKEATVYSSSTVASDSDLQQLMSYGIKSLKNDVNLNSSDDPYISISSSGYSSQCHSSSFDDSLVSCDVIPEEVFDEPAGKSEKTQTESFKQPNLKSQIQERRNGKTIVKPLKKNLSERIIFKAQCGVQPYSGVFRLDDDIKYLKTFIQLISGLPPSRQKYFAYEEEDNENKRIQKRRKVKTLRQLGFKDGQTIHLDIKST